ncbi:MAG: molybdopterin-binding protein [Bradyrhizobium sp.]|uniref:molybdopterin-binding protein n=1 Tax=Bradyrhizobium sp. TaxID=376 RepID=UPI0025BD2D06|nr:molybdopterin-binding protein [Bradyrhizobium sp.]MBI5260765.1 molybdopterin-binding protein [Bradyrhizobium sp.]
MTTQRLPSSLTPYDQALATLLHGLQPVPPMELSLEEALGCIAAEMPAVSPCPAFDVAAADGWAVGTNDVIGASSYSPLPQVRPPVWVNVGDAMPDGCDCVLDADAVETSGPIAEIVAEGAPGRGVRRAGSDLAGGPPPIVPGIPIGSLDFLVARAAGLGKLQVRRPRLRIVNLPGGDATARLIADYARSTGASVTNIEARARDTGSVARMLDIGDCDLLITIGGSGVGRNDATISALAGRGEVLVHGVALQPGRTAAIARVGAVPALALPGSPDQALAAWLTLAVPALDHLCGRERSSPVTRPLARKIASSVGLAEIALLEQREGAWLPLAVGHLSLEAIVRAEAWLLVPAWSEGFAAGTPVDAHLWRE